MDIENTTLKEKVLPENPMKQWLVNYVGETYSMAVEKHNSEEQEKMEWDGNVQDTLEGFKLADEAAQADAEE